MYNEKIFILTNSISVELKKDIKTRLNFYLPEFNTDKLEIVNSQSINNVSPKDIILLFGIKKDEIDIQNKERFFDIDFRTNHMDGWEWHVLMKYYYSDTQSAKATNETINTPAPNKLFYGKNRIKDVLYKSKYIKRFAGYLKQKYQKNTIIKPVNQAHQNLINYTGELQKSNFTKAYILGTGPSLEKAIKQDWSDGYRIVCNTIVKDKELWNHINPHFIVAGDAIYHFGHTLFAKAFRTDLKQRLAETNTFFLFPESFKIIVFHEFPGLENRLIPVPIGLGKKIHVNLTKHFKLPGLGNSLNLLLLPLACTLAKNIYLWGFDGRAPDDTDFWKNSKKHSYPEHFQELKKSHPAFFEHFVPENDPTKYVEVVHGDLLDQNLTEAENEGFNFVMMHDTWTKTLKKRMK
jgi:hypothetical protein